MATGVAPPFTPSGLLHGSIEADESKVILSKYANTPFPEAL
jgi:hypothetical protein